MGSLRYSAPMFSRFHSTGFRSALGAGGFCAGALLLFAVPLSGASSRMQAGMGAAAPASAGCTLQKHTYTCNFAAFRQDLAAAHTVTVETQRLDRPTANQLRQLVQALGKSVAGTTPENGAAPAADLTFLLIPMENSGINFGPQDHELATLRIYAPGTGTSHGTLLWAEVLRGQGDRPWPAQVHALIEQFQDRLGRP